MEIEDGIVASFSSTTLGLMDGTTFAIDGDTKIKGALAVGARVEVEAEVQPDDGLLATKIKVDRKLEFESIIVDFSSTTLEILDGTIFVINEDTKTKGTFAVDAEVEVKAEVAPDGSLVATRIKVEEVEEFEAGEEEEGDVLEFKGVVTSFSTTTLVLVENGLTFDITGAQIEGTLAENAEVEVQAVETEDGLIAISVTVKGAGDEEEEEEEMEDGTSNGAGNGDSDSDGDGDGDGDENGDGDGGSDGDGEEDEDVDSI